ncbi:uncharacterized protein [Oscarella lobularis]|uniref:uncharacterized protein n=1 Tax=Oscarella lobularis TaxID=121494 RepID=UPI0033142379
MSLSLLAFVAFCAACNALDNGLARSPPMGWNTYNFFKRNYNEAVIIETAQALVETGMRDRGYVYVNIDGGWWEGVGTGTAIRNSSGYLEYDKKRFPSGMLAISNYIHSLDLKFGMYTDAGERFCNRDKNASQGHETQDAELFASWGADYVKVDACRTTESPEILMNRWKNALNATKRPMVFSNCLNNCTLVPNTWHSWCPVDSNLWRTCEDIDNNWEAVMTNLDSVANAGKKGAPGGWNDPDMLEVGNPGLSVIESRSHFSLWCITSAPLIAGNDIRNMTKDITEILTNAEAIRINQEYAGNAGQRVHTTSTTEIWYKPLPNSEHAVILFNRAGKTSTTITASWKLFNLEDKTECKATNIWNQTEVEIKVSDHIQRSVGVHDVAFFRLTDCT